MFFNVSREEINGFLELNGEKKEEKSMAAYIPFSRQNIQVAYIIQIDRQVDTQIHIKITDNFELFPGAEEDHSYELSMLSCYFLPEMANNVLVIEADNTNGVHCNNI